MFKVLAYLQQAGNIQERIWVNRNVVITRIYRSSYFCTDATGYDETEYVDDSDIESESDNNNEVLEEILPNDIRNLTLEKISCISEIGKFYIYI